MSRPLAVDRGPCERCPPGGAHLTAREIEVLVLAAAGSTSQRIGRVLGISVRTVNLHIETMLRRAGARSRAELTARCYAAGILAPRVWPPAWSGCRCLSVAPQARSARAVVPPARDVNG